MAAKKASKGKKGRKANPKKPKRRRAHNATPAAPKRRRRKANPAPRRRRRRSNPGLGDLKGGLMKLMPDLKEIGGFIGVNLMINFAVLRFGQAGSVMGGSASSTMGAAWSGRNYAIGLGAAWLASKLAGNLLRGSDAATFSRTVFRDGIKSLASRLFWTEGLSRSDWLRNTFGAAVQVTDDGYGNRWMTLPDGTQIAMAGLVSAGPMGQLVAAGPMGTLVPTGQYDGMMEDAIYDDGAYGDDVADDDLEGGTLVEARPIDAGGYLLPGGGRRFTETSPNDSYKRTFRRFAPI